MVTLFFKGTFVFTKWFDQFFVKVLHKTLELHYLLLTTGKEILWSRQIFEINRKYLFWSSPWSKVVFRNSGLCEYVNLVKKVWCLEWTLRSLSLAAIYKIKFVTFWVKKLPHFLKSDFLQLTPNFYVINSYVYIRSNKAIHYTSVALKKKLCSPHLPYYLKLLLGKCIK